MPPAFFGSGLLWLFRILCACKGILGLFFYFCEKIIDDLTAISLNL
jgi:hypothetical protein